MTDHMPQSPPALDDDPTPAIRRLKLWIRMLGVTRRAENQLREYLRVEHDTTLPRFDVMAALYRFHDGLTMTELSRTLLISNGNATTVVNRLVQDGLIMRIHSDEDRRRITVRLTPKGISTFETVATGHRDMIDRLFSGIEGAELDQMRDSLRALRDGMAADTGSSEPAPDGA